jgi:hypothetical protein
VRSVLNGGSGCEILTGDEKPPPIDAPMMKQVSNEVRSKGPRRLFWEQSWRDLRHNLAVAWPIFIGFAVVVFVSSFLLWKLERLSFGDALYLTWITMTTVGYGDIKPCTAAGRVTTSADALVGIILVGVIVWLVTQSLTRD